MTEKRQHIVPLAAPTVALIAGIVMVAQGTPRWPLLLALATNIVLAVAVSRWPRVQSALLVSGFVWVGMLSAQRVPPPVNPNVATEAVVAGEPQEKPKTVAVDLLLPGQDKTVRRYLWKDRCSLSLQPGDALVLHKVGDGYVPAADWQRGGNAFSRLSHWSRVRLRCLQWRHRLLLRLHSQSVDDDAYGVLAAMTLGDKTALSRQMRDAYAVAGLSHVLALSGLHIGIIYMLLTMGGRGRRRYWLWQVAAVLGLWTFAFLTGLSPSVVRASLMLSICAVFSLGGRTGASVNLLCLAAMVILLCDASSLYDVGFQLSFVSVLSILLFMPLVNQLCPVRSRPLRWLRDVLGVSAVAQLGVAPLVAFYFGRFPTYFLLTNLIAVPVVMLMVYAGLAAVLFPSVAPVVLKGVEYVNKALGWIAQMPCSSIDGLHPSLLRVVLLYVLLAAVYLLISRLSLAAHRSGWPRP